MSISETLTSIKEKAVLAFPSTDRDALLEQRKRERKALLNRPDPVIGGVSNVSDDVKDVEWRVARGQYYSTPIVGPLIPRPMGFVPNRGTNNVDDDAAIRSIPFGGVDGVTTVDDAVARFRHDVATVDDTSRRARRSGKDRLSGLAGRVRGAVQSAGLWSPIADTEPPEYSVPQNRPSQPDRRVPQPVRVPRPERVQQPVPAQVPAAVPTPEPVQRQEPVRIYSIARDNAIEAASVVTPALPAAEHRRKRTHKSEDKPAKKQSKDITVEVVAAPGVLSVVPGAARDEHRKRVREVERMIDRNIHSIAARQAARRAVREFSERAEAQTSRKLQWFDAGTARDMYISIIDHLTEGQQITSMSQPEVEQLQHIAQDLMKHIQKHRTGNWADAVPAREVGNMARFLHEYFGSEYKKKMGGIIRARARKQFFETFVSGYISAKEVEATITAETERRRAA